MSLIHVHILFIYQTLFIHGTWYQGADGSAHQNEAPDINFEVENESGAALPNTGGPGTGLIYLLGIMLTGLAGAGLAMRLRRKAV